MAICTAGKRNQRSNTDKKNKKQKQNIHHKINSKSTDVWGVVYHNLFIRPVYNRVFESILFESVKGVIVGIVDPLVLLRFLFFTLSSSTTGHQNKHSKKTGTHAEVFVATVA